MKKEKKMFYGWWIVFVGFLVYALVYSSISTGGVFTLPITKEFGFARSSYSLRTLFAAAGSIIGSFTMGRFIAKHNIKHTMVGSCIILILSVIGSSFCTQLWQFYAMSLLQGFGFTGASMIPVPVLINSWFGSKKKGLAMSIALAGAGVGGMVMTVILNWFCQNQGWRSAYFANAAVYLITIPFIVLLVVRSPKEKGLERLGEVSVNGTISDKAGVAYSEGKGTRVYWIVLGSFFLMAAVNAGILNHEIPYFNEVGFTASKAAGLGALAVGSLAVGKLILGTMCDRFGIKKTLFFGNVSLLAAMILIYCAGGLHSVGYVYVLFYAVGGSTASIAIPLVVSAVWGDKDFSRYLGSINVVTGLGSPAGSVFCGVLYDVTGSYGTAWITFAIVSVLIVLMQISIFRSGARKLETAEV